MAQSLRRRHPSIRDSLQYGPKAEAIQARKTRKDKDPRTVAAKYFESWKAHDFATFRSLLADDAMFTGPMGTAKNADECVEGIKGMSKMVTDIVIRRYLSTDRTCSLGMISIPQTQNHCPRQTGATSRMAKSPRYERPSILVRLHRLPGNPL